MVQAFIAAEADDAASVDQVLVFAGGPRVVLPGVSVGQPTPTMSGRLGRYRFGFDRDAS
jgi:hypothetical protein